MARSARKQQAAAVPKQAPPKRRRGAGKPFQKGVSGNPKGRPIGSRQRLTEGFINALSDDFEVHGADTIRRMRKEKPDAYIRVVADLVPKDINLGGEASEAFVELWKQVSGK